MNPWEARLTRVNTRARKDESACSLQTIGDLVPSCQIRFQWMQRVATGFWCDLLFDDGLDQVSRPVDVDAAVDCQCVGQQLKRHDLEDSG